MEEIYLNTKGKNMDMRRMAAKLRKVQLTSSKHTRTCYFANEQFRTCIAVSLIKNKEVITKFKSKN